MNKYGEIMLPFDMRIQNKNGKEIVIGSVATNPNTYAVSISSTIFIFLRLSLHSIHERKKKKKEKKEKL